MTAPEVPPRTLRIDQPRVDRYAEAARDPNPIHRETREAYEGPFGRPVVHGMLVLAVASDAMASVFAEAWAAGGSLKVRWRTPAVVPLTVTARATLKSESDGVATYDVTCEGENGDVLLTGTASVRYE